MKWSKEEDDILRAEWGLKPAREIIKQIPGRSRNACIGRAKRLGLERLINKQRSETHSPWIHANIKRIRRVRFIEPKIRLVPTEPLNIEFFDLKSWHCRQIVSGTGDYGLPLFCGCQVQECSSYCARHHRINHVRIVKSLNETPQAA